MKHLLSKQINKSRNDVEGFSRWCDCVGCQSSCWGSCKEGCGGSCKGTCWDTCWSESGHSTTEPPGPIF